MLWESIELEKDLAHVNKYMLRESKERNQNSNLLGCISGQLRILTQGQTKGGFYFEDKMI